MAGDRAVDRGRTIGRTDGADDDLCAPTDHRSRHHLTHHFSRPGPSRPRSGSGTVVGVMLVLLAAALLGALMTGSSLVIRRAEARQEADLAALSAASARAGLLPGSPPCGRAASVLAAARPRGSASAASGYASTTASGSITRGSAAVSANGPTTDVQGGLIPVAQHGPVPGAPSGARSGSVVSAAPWLVSCRLDGQDTVVTVRVGSGPLSALTQTSARAGPADCASRETDGE